MPIEKSCDLCKKQGLAIMPVRYAVVPGEATAPKLAAPFKIEDASTGFGTAAPRKHLASLGTEESANYTLRRMRAGYLYVYNEKAALKLQGYSVSSGGYFLPLPPGTLAPIPQAGKEIIPCNEKGHQEAGSCITIEHPHEAAEVWLAFSDVQWTDAVIKQHTDRADVRKLHMRKLNVAAWAKAHPLSKDGKGSDANAEHAVPVSKLADHVLEYNAAKIPAHILSGVTKHDAKAQEALCMRLDNTIQGAVVALDDPVGIAQDLAKLLAARREKFLDTRVPEGKYRPIAGGDATKKAGGYATNYRHLIGLDGMIAMLHGASDNAAKQDVNQWAQYKTGVSQAYATKGIYSNPFPPKVALDFAAEVSQKIDDDFLPTLTQIKFAQEQQWNDYLARIARPLPAASPSAGLQRLKDEQIWQKKLEMTHFNSALDRLKAIEQHRIGALPQDMGKTPSSARIWDQWHKDHDAAAKAYDAKYTTAVAQAHAEWMQSNQLANKLECTHDANDPKSGDVYTASLTRCIAGTTQVSGCAEVYLHWLKGDITQKSNLALRAMACNQKPVIDALAKSPLAPADVPWAALNSTYASHFKALLELTADEKLQAKKQAGTEVANAQTAYDKASKDYLKMVRMQAGIPTTAEQLVPVAAARDKLDATKAKAPNATAARAMPDSVSDLVAKLSNSLTGLASTALTVIAGAAGNAKLSQGLVLMGVLTRAPVGILELKGTAGEMCRTLAKFYAGIVANAAEANGTKLSKGQLYRLEAQAMREARINYANGNLAGFGAKQGQQVTTRILIQGSRAPAFATALKVSQDPIEQITALSKTTRSFQSVQEWNAFKVERVSPAVSATSCAVIALFDTIIKGASWQQLLRDEAKAMSFNRGGISDLRVTIGLMAFTAGIGNNVVTIVDAAAKWRNLYAVGMVEVQSAEKLLGFTDKLLKGFSVVGAVIGAVQALMDVVDASDSYKQAKLGLMWTQVISGIVGFGAAGLAIWAAFATGPLALILIGVGLVLAVALLLISKVIDAIKGDEIAQWLERCYWGSNLDGFRINDTETEQEDFKKLALTAAEG
jgi:hypothetical protein